MTNTYAKKTKPRLSIKIQFIATLAAIVSAVALPQIFHIIGAVSGAGTALGETFLPMHLPIILTGLLAGPYAGALSGLLSPIVSFALTGMPMINMLPFMIAELCAYGFFSGLLRNVRIPSIAKVAITQLAGRAVRAAAILISVYAFGNANIQPSIIWTSIVTGLFGLILQWTLLPLIVYRIENFK